MDVVATVLRRAFVRERLIVTDIVGAHAVDTVCHANDQRTAQVTDEGTHRDVHNVVAEAATIGPTAGDDSADVKRMPGNQSTWKRIATEDAQPREAGVIRIRRVPKADAGKTHARRRAAAIRAGLHEDSLPAVRLAPVGARPLALRAGLSLSVEHVRHGWRLPAVREGVG